MAVSAIEKLNLPAGGGGLYISGSSAYSWLNLRTERI